ncbi:MAG TPA: ABC transporter ATP-binding protein [Nitrososphaeria archaeon]|nr:MAG: ABC transporter ATP-binding protein [Nitrososphaerota archaeon]HDJ66252.1 ABC transporter ATP-binding protein [Nitrososphaeria archaeon]
MIKFESVEYVYPSGVKALDGVDLEIGDGEIVAIMGENGAGKTTLIKHLNGLLKPTKGKVLIDGIDTRKVTVASLSRKVGIVFQNPDDMFFSENIWEEVAFALRNFGYDEEVVKRRVENAINFMDLANYVDKSPFTLSGGEKKRLALAIVLAWSPDIIALDEPTIGQDILQKEKLLQVIKLLNSQGKTIIVSSHDIEFVADLKPRIILMKRGRVIANGNAEEIFLNEELLRLCNLLPPQLISLSKELSFIGVKPKLYSPRELAAEIMMRLQR